MNRLIKYFGITFFCAITSTAFAGGWFRAPYIGVEVIQTNQDYKEAFGDDVFKENPQDYSIFGGFKFSQYFGLELGYEFQPRRSQSVLLTAGQTPPGGTVLTGSESLGLDSNITGYHPYVGLFAEYDQKCSWIGRIKWQALVAASFSEIKAKETLTSDSGVPTEPVSSSFVQHKVVPMVKLSGTGFVTDHIGVRVSLNYHNFNEFQIHGAGTSEIKLKDTFGIGLGLTYSFFKC